MRTLPQAWNDALEARCPVSILASIDPVGRHPITTEPHLALHPGVLTATVARDLRRQSCIVVDHADTGRILPFYPYLSEWPTVTKSLDLSDLRADIAAVTIKIAGHRAFLERLGLATNATIRLDLWSSGIDLDEVIPIFAGRTSGDALVDLESGTATIPFIDGNPKSAAVFPEIRITREDFPDAPQESIGVYAQVIFGLYQGRIPCVPISNDRRRWLIQAGEWTQTPTAVQRGGVTITAPYRFIPMKGATTGVPYLELAFQESPDQLVAGSSGSITVSGGIGGLARHPIEYLSSFAGIPVHPETRALLRSSPELQDVWSLNSSPAPAMDLIIRRLAPQLGYAATQDLYMTRLIDLGQDLNGPAIRLHSELLFSMSEKWERTPEERIYNSIEFNCGRDRYSGSDSPLAVVLRNPGWPSPVRELQAMSQSIFTHRHMERGYPMPDVTVQYSSSGQVIGCVAGERVGNKIARLYAFPWASQRYACRPDFGYRVERGDCFLLTDPDYGIEDKPCKVVAWSLPPSGPQVTIAVQQMG